MTYLAQSIPDDPCKPGYLISNCWKVIERTRSADVAIRVKESNRIRPPTELEGEEIEQRELDLT